MSKSTSKIPTKNKYSPPVDRLLSYGKASIDKDWPNYVEQFGFTEADIPELLRLAADDSLTEGDEDDPKNWGPIHALRVLGQLRSPSAVGPLIKVFKLYDDWDWFNEEVIDVFHLIGPAAIPELSAYFSNDDNDMYNRIVVANTLQKIGNTLKPEKDVLKYSSKNSSSIKKRHRGEWLFSFLLDRFKRSTSGETHRTSVRRRADF
jgi:hypothetical protein